MKFGKDYGVKVDWSLYRWWRRLICYIPVVRLFFTEKFRVEAIATTSMGAPCVGVHKDLRFPTDRRYGVYNILARFPDGSGAVVVAKVLTLIRDKQGETIGKTTHPIKPGEDLKWSQYYIRKDAYRPHITL